MNESTLVQREEMNDLDWLARNVHMWVHGQEYTYVMKDQYENRSVSVFAYHSFYSKFSRDQWLSRRAELQNKPSWEDAPEWANLLSQGLSGTWYWHEFKPVLGDCAYFSVKGKYTLQRGGVVLGDWRDTLEKRPETNEMPSHSNKPKPSTDIQECAEVKQFEPFVSVEDAKITIMQSEGDVKHFGGVIGRSITSKEDAAAAKQHDPVNSPSHYASGGIECIDAIKASMSHEAFLGYLKGNVQKYMWRYEKKVNPSEDLKKARWYLDKLIEEQK